MSFLGEERRKKRAGVIEIESHRSSPAFTILLFFLRNSLEKNLLEKVEVGKGKNDVKCCAFRIDY